MADDFMMIKQIQDEAKARAEAGQPYRRTVELSDGSIYGETVTVAHACPVPKPEWVAAVLDVTPDDETAADG